MTAYVNRSETLRDDLDPLAEVPTTTVKGASLRAGMVLVDRELMTPEAEIDHRMRATPRAGEARFLVFDFETRRYVPMSFGRNASIRVMAEVAA